MTEREFQREAHRQLTAGGGEVWGRTIKGVANGTRSARNTRPRWPFLNALPLQLSPVCDISRD